MANEPRFYRCGVCGIRVSSESEIREHIAKPTSDGAHDGEPWEVCNDQLAVVARKVQANNGYGESLVPWDLFGAWWFVEPTLVGSTNNHAGLGREIAELFRRGYVEVRVLHIRDAVHLRDSTRGSIAVPHAD